MLYNPKWSKTKKVTQPTLRGFIAWLKKQNPDAEYEHMDPLTCAVGLYARSIGKTYGTLFGGLLCTHGGVRRLESWDSFIAEPLPHTFGAALERAKAFVE